MKLFKQNEKYKIYYSIMLGGIGMYLFAVLPVIDIHSCLTKYLVNNGFNNFLIAIGTGMFASALTALMIDKSHEKEQEKLAMCMKKQILFDTLCNLKYWIAFDDEVRKYEFKLNAKYMDERIKECRRAVDFSIPYLNEEEYLALSTIETQLKQMLEDAKELKEDGRYKKYRNIYEWLLYDDELNDDIFQAYEYEQMVVKLYGIDNKEAYEIALSVISFNKRLGLIKNNLAKFDYLAIDEF